MLQILGSLLGTLAKIFAWGSLMYVLWILFSIIKKRLSTGSLCLKEWLIFGICIIYITAFILTRIIFPDLFASLFSIGFIVILIITMQWVKYEDRKAGRRWWQQ